MKSCIFLIVLLGFICISFCSLPVNVSEDNVCPVTWFRRKRADSEYTRWRSNMETTAEFIVKVLDDDVTVVGSSKPAGVNIQPATKRSERIIVGGAMVPSLSTSGSELPREYTRFMPPTVSRTDSVKKDQSYLAPTQPSFRDALLPIRQDLLPTRKPSRDDSPPGSPQFLPRTPPHLPAHTRQYAPIAPVAFTRRTTGTPLTPPLYDRYNTYPTRSPLPSSPTRTMGLLDKLEKLEDFPIFDALISDDDNKLLITRSTLNQGPIRTQSYMETEILDEELDHYFSRSTIRQDQQSTLQMLTENFNKFSELNQKELGLRRDNTEGEKDTNYDNMFFYDTDYRDSNSTNELDNSRRIEIDTNMFKENASTTEVHSEDIDNSNTLGELEPDRYVIENKMTDVKNLNRSITTSTDRVIDSDEPKITDIVSREKRRPVCSMIKLRPLSFNTPRTLPEIVDQLKQWMEESPIAKWIDMTGGNLTTMENPIYIMKVDDPSVGQVTSQKQNVLLISGINGRDHHAVTSAMYILYQLIERSEMHKDLLTKYRFWIVPVFNPDGYDYSMTFPQRRDWSKNLHQTWEPCKGRESCQYCSTHGIRCSVSPCYGVNLDRNFEYQWISPDELRAEHPCGNLYAGPRQMSEVETQALNNFLHSQHISISVFIAFKEGAVLGVLYPYSHTKKRRAFDQIYRQRANRAAAAAASVTDRKYIAGQNSEFLPLYAGGIEDWADGHLGIDNTYTVMMFRPSDMPNSKLLGERVIHEAYAAMDSLLLSSLPGRTQPLTITANKASSLHLDLFVMGLTSLAMYLFGTLL